MTTDSHLTVDMGLVLTEGAAEVRAEIDRSDLARQSNTPVSVSVSAPGTAVTLYMTFAQAFSLKVALDRVTTALAEEEAGRSAA